MAKLSDIRVIQDAQAKHMEQIDNALMNDTQDRPPKPSRKMSYHSDWSDSDNKKDNQARAPITNTPKNDSQPSTSYAREDTLLRPNTYPKVLTFGRGKIALLAIWNNVSKGHRCGLNINHTPQVGVPIVAVVSPDKNIHTDRI